MKPETSESPGLNYFNYFTEIEDTFVRRRGKHLLLSPFDWALIETWKQIGIPLHVVLRGIERAFDSWEAKPRKRSVKSLLYCQEEVEAQHAEWLESRVGSQAEDYKPPERSGNNENVPFSRAAILAYLNQGRAAVWAACERRRRFCEDDFADALARVAALLAELIADFGNSPAPDTRRLEESLTGLERMLTDAIGAIVSPEDRERLGSEVIEQLSSYRAHMDKEVYQQTFDNLLLKRLREEFAVPRLSLFYL